MDKFFERHSRELLGVPKKCPTFDLKCQDPLMTNNPIFSKNALDTSSHIDYQSSLEHKNVVNLKDIQLFYLGMK